MLGSLRLKIALGVFAIIAIATIIAVWASTVKVSDQFRSYSRLQTEHLLNFTIMLVEQSIGRAQLELIELAKNPLFAKVVLENNESEVQAAIERFSSFAQTRTNFLENVGVQNMKGIVLATDTAAASIIGQDFSYREYYQKTIATQAPYVSSAFVSAVSGNVILAVTAPITDESGSMVGYLIATINVVKLHQQLASLQEDTNTLILDREHHVFLETNDRAARIHEANEIDEGIVKIQEALVRGEKIGSIEHKTIEDESDIDSFKARDYFTVVVSKRASIVLNFIGGIILSQIGIAITTVFLLYIAIWILLGMILSRLSHVTAVAEKIIKGENAEIARDDMRANDEVGILLRAISVLHQRCSISKKDLEHKILERTADLERSKKEMATQLAELDRINKLMVDRELKMIELKKNVKRPNNKDQQKG